MGVGIKLSEEDLGSQVPVWLPAAGRPPCDAALITTPTPGPFLVPQPALAEPQSVRMGCTHMAPSQVGGEPGGVCHRPVLLLCPTHWSGGLGPRGLQVQDDLSAGFPEVQALFPVTHTQLIFPPNPVRGQGLLLSPFDRGRNGSREKFGNTRSHTTSRGGRQDLEPSGAVVSSGVGQGEEQTRSGRNCKGCRWLGWGFSARDPVVLGPCPCPGGDTQRPPPAQARAGWLLVPRSARACTLWLRAL